MSSRRLERAGQGTVKEGEHRGGLSAQLALLLLAGAGLSLLLTSALAAPPARAVSDTSIERAVEMMLLTDPWVPQRAIKVAAVDKVVRLTGEVDNLQAYYRAAQLAKEVKGVSSVINLLEVRPEPRPDAEIGEDIERGLEQHPATQLFEIQVAVKDRRVTLSGTVSSWQEKWLARDVAQAVRGVIGLDNRLAVRMDNRRSDEQVKRDIEARLGNDARVYEALVDVQVEQGRVTLSGTVPSLAKKEIVTTDAWVIGVRDVEASALKVDYDLESFRRNTLVTPERGDRAIAAAVEEAMLYDPRVVSTRPEVSVQDQRVTLKGTVASLGARFAAEQDAANTVGVQRVKNYLRVRPGLALSDEQIETNVLAALQRNAVLADYGINVEVLNGKAFLSGTVPSYYDRWYAEQIAADIRGVEALSNNLIVKRRVTFEDDQRITNRIEDMIFWSPSLNASEIEVEVDNGVAVLSGTVPTWAQRWSAEAKAQRAGALRVVNKLEVIMATDRSG